MKRILVFSHAMELGGAERALLGLLENIDYTKYQVDLFLMRHGGELLPYLPKQVHLLPEIPQYASLAIPITQVIGKRQFQIAIGRIIGKILAKKRIQKLNFPLDNGVELEYSHKYTACCMPRIEKGEYDLAISFLTPHYFVNEKVQAKKEIAWIHTDYTEVKVDVQSELKMWGKYDNIIAISHDVAKSFLTIFPSLKSKVVIIENMMPVKSIKKQAGEFSVQQEMPIDGSKRLLSIGRFCTAKNFDSIPDICRKILLNGIDIKWYLIGFGKDEELIQNKIKEYNMENNIIILGKKINPYPYIKACDLYVQPSRYEGNAVSVHEAQILEKPVVITEYATSASQLENGIDGIIVPLENSGCAKALTKILCNKELLDSISENERKKDYTNAEGLQKLYSLF